ncbi:MAG: Neutral ceramidase [candidate division WS2 bacterium]|nr:Neutral ceramidase [Candidatus Psychracetigena formicireducens]
MISLKAGVGKSDITPGVGVELAGYGPFLERKSTGIHDPLFCKALLLESEKEKGLILICDLVGIKGSLVKEVREFISAHFPISSEKILIGGTHTHSGPNTGGYIAWGEEDRNYFSDLPKLILPAVEEAIKNLKEAKMGISHWPFAGEEISVNRVEPEKGVNKDIGLIKLVEKKNEKPLAFLVNFGVHAVVQGPANTLISRDWPGMATDIIAERLGAETIFLQGACGDINSKPACSKDPEEGFRRIGCIGKLFAEAAIEGLRKLPAKESERFSFNQFFIDLPLNPISKEELLKIIKDNEAIFGKGGGKAEEGMAQFQMAGAREQLSFYEKGEVGFLKAEVQLIEIDNSLIITVPTEHFSEFAHALKESLPEKEVFVVTQANGSIGYIPSVYDFENKLYASTFTPRVLGNMPFQKDVGNFLTKGILTHINSLDSVNNPL